MCFRMLQNNDRILLGIMAAIAGSAGAAGDVYQQPCAEGMREMLNRATTLNGIDL